MKYYLTFWQRMELIPIGIMWLFTGKGKRKPWPDVKKGMEKHNHNFVKPFAEKGYNFLQCDHQGCMVCKTND